MTLTELRYIVAVANFKHFGKAAEECFVSQPTLSVGIRKLEEYLGVTIFERGRSEVKITPIGQLIINQAEQVLNETQVIRNIADLDKDQLKRPINIATTYTIGKYLFPHLIKQAYNTSPNLSLLFSQDYQEELIKKLQNNEVDVLILTSVELASEHDDTQNNNEVLVSDFLKLDFNAEPVLKEELYLLAAQNNKYSNHQELSLQDLDFNDLYLLNNQHCLRDQVLSLKPSFDASNTKINQCNFDNLESLYQIVKQNNGATVVPALFKQDNNTELNLIPFKDPKPNRVLSLVWRKDFTRPQAIEVLKTSLAKINLSGIEKYM